MSRKKGFLLTVFTAAVLLLSAVPAFADAVAPGPLDMLKYRIEEYFPLILIAVLVLAAVTALVVILVIRKKKRK